MKFVCLLILCKNYPQFLQSKKTDSCIISMTDQDQKQQLVVGKIIAANENLPLLYTVQNEQPTGLKFYEALVFEIPKKSISTITTIAGTTDTNTIQTNTERKAITTTTHSPKTVVVNEGLDLKKILDENLGNKLVVSEHNVIEPNLNEETKKIIKEASISHSQNNDCNCTQRI